MIMDALSHFCIAMLVGSTSNPLNLLIYISQPYHPIQKKIAAKMPFISFQKKKLNIITYNDRLE